jgi:cytidine deaminase
VANEQQLGRAGRADEPGLSVPGRLGGCWRSGRCDVGHGPTLTGAAATRPYAGSVVAGDLTDLFDAAVAVQRHAYAPYSGFPVGAAVRAASGRIFVGCNVENASFPEGICAEAAAIGAMVAAGERELVEVLTVADGERLTTCCGGCRQRIRELARPGTPVHAAGPEGIRRTFTIEELLPSAFGA